MQYLISGIVLFSLVLGSCHTEPAIVHYSRANAIDSFVIDSVEDGQGLSNFAAINESELVGYSYMTMNMSTYRKNKRGYSLSKCQALPDTFFSMAFFIDSAHHQPCLIGIENQCLFRLEADGQLKKILHIQLDLPVLKEQYRFFHTADNPVTVNDSSLLLNIAPMTPYDYQKQFYEKGFAEVVIKNDSITKVNYLFDYPKGIEHDIFVNPVYCSNGTKMLVVYPCIDSIYAYDRATQQYKTYPIRNKQYSPSAHYDASRWMEADYVTKLRFNSFYYEGIFFNPKTRHYVLYYVPPVDKHIKVPSYNDQEYFALVLDEQFKHIKTVKFLDKFRWTGNFLLTPQGIAMPLYSKNYKYEKTYQYYYFDL